MTVQELMSILENMEPDAEVVLAFQRSWPLEFSVARVALRADIEPEDGGDDEDKVGDDDDAEPQRHRREEGSPNDVILVEGQHLRYGHRGVWSAANRG
jgi:hypothetical protein